MSMIERYRKKGGFLQLLNLIETSSKDKQEKFLKMIAEENPAWEAEIRNKMLTLDKVFAWNSSYLMEVFPRMQAIQLTMVAASLPADKKAKFFEALPFRERKQVEETLKEKTFNANETATGVLKLFTEIRKMAQEGSLKFEKFDPSLAMPENIEDTLDTNVFRATLSPKETEQISQPPPSGTPPQVAEEMQSLRKKVLVLSQENQKLVQENQSMRFKLDQIKKIA